MSAISTILANYALVILEIIIKILICGTGTAIIIGLSKLISKFNLQNSEEVVTSVTDIVKKVVIQLNQTKVNDLKKSQENGLTDDQQEEIYNIAKNLVLSFINSDQMNILCNYFNNANIDDILKLLIENAVSAEKSDK